MNSLNKNKKVLFVATVNSHIINFHLPYLKMFKEKEYEVSVCTGEKGKIQYCDKKYEVPVTRSPYKINNLKAIKQLKKICDEEKFDIIHCHTPMGSVVTRLAAKNARKKYGTRVIYTAHGFHFYKGAPILNWLLFYPIEKWLAKYTDTLITINTEDYERAKRKFRKRCKDIQLVNGVGFDTTRFDIKMTDEEQEKLREEIGVSKENIVLTYVAEINKNKNQIMLIKTLQELIKENNNYRLIIVGDGVLRNQLEEYVKNNNIQKYVYFLGKRKDIPQILKITNIYVASSLREGLPVNIIEAMYMKLPIVAMDNRGHRELVEKKHIVHNFEEMKNVITGISFTKKYTYKEIDKYLLTNIKSKMLQTYDKKKKVLHVLASNKYSGAENVVCTIIEGFKEKYDMMYCSPSGPIDKILKEKEIKYIPLKKLSIKELRKVVSDYNPDIIHAHDYMASFIASFLVKNKIKLISHIHNNCEYAKKWNLKTIAYTLRINKISKIIGVSNKIYEEAVYKEIVKSKYETIYNFIDEEDILKRAQLYISPKKYDLFFLGRMSKAKNPVLFIQIIKKIRIKKTEIKCVMIGDGELFDECMNIIKTENLENNIDLVGFKSNPFPIILNSKIGIMPSLWEGFGLAAIESLVLNKPILNSGVGGLGEIFKDNKNLICKSIDEYEKKFLKLINDNKKFDYKNITMIYCDKDKWQKKIRELYQ